jgi:hypothetical protein
MNTATTNQVADRLARIQTSMIDMTNIIKLARFAAEARRTLKKIDDLANINPEVEAAINKHVEAKNEWEMCPDVVGEVLGYAINRLELDQDELESAISTMHRSATGSAQTGSAS